MDFHVGEIADVVVEMHTAQGNVTSNYDKAAGITWESSHPDQVQVEDEDAEPRDAVVSFVGLLPDEDAFVRCSFDGKVGPDERRIDLVSDPIRVVEGEAVAGRLRLTMREET